MNALGNATAAELFKLRSLPAAVMAAVGTVVAGICLNAAVAASGQRPPEAEQVMAQVIVLLQVGPIAFGVLAAASEYTGRQIATTLTATPNRLMLLSGKGIAFLVAATTTGIASTGAGAAAAAVVLNARGIHHPTHIEPRVLAGAGLYLVLIGLLAFAVAIALRSLIPPLAVMLVLVLIVSSLAAGYSEHARWLPDRAGRLLYLPDGDPVLTAGTGALVLLAWVAMAGIAASVAFSRRDA